MPKFVCDTDEVKNNGEKLCEAAADMESSLKTYSGSISSDLSEWNSPAKTKFTQVNNTEIVSAAISAGYINSFGEFLKEFAAAVEKEEENLASQIKI